MAPVASTLIPLASRHMPFAVSHLPLGDELGLWTGPL